MARAKHPVVVVVGSLNMDLVVRAPRIPVPGETVLGGAFETAPGGKGANQAVAASRMGATVRMVGRVGDDAFGASLLRALAEARVDCSHVHTTPGHATGVGLIVVEEGSGQNAIVVAPGANAALSPDDVRAAEPLLAACDVAVLQLEVPLETVLEAARVCSSHGACVVLNPAPARALGDDLLGLVDVAVPNEVEAAILAGMPMASVEDATRAARALLRRGPKVVVATLGSRGAVAAEGEQAWFEEAFPVHAVDATASGDAFVGTLVVALAEGRPLREAVMWANAAGALAATVHGAMPSLPTRCAVEDLAATRLALRRTEGAGG